MNKKVSSKAGVVLQSWLFGSPLTEQVARPLSFSSLLTAVTVRTDSFQAVDKLSSA